MSRTSNAKAISSSLGILPEIISSVYITHAASSRTYPHNPMFDIAYSGTFLIQSCSR